MRNYVRKQDQPKPLSERDKQSLNYWWTRNQKDKQTLERYRERLEK